MKIIKADAVYIQKKDIVFLTNTTIPIPTSIFAKGYELEDMSDYDRFEFYRFTKKPEINYLKTTDLIIDYDDIKDLDEKRISELGQKLIDRCNNISARYNIMSNRERNKNIELLIEYQVLTAKIKDLLYYLKGYPKKDIKKANIR